MPTSINIKGLDVVKKRMRSLLKEVNSSPTGMTKIGLLGVRDVVDHFNKSQSPNGAWSPLKYRSGQPLADTGLLKNSTRYKVTGRDCLIFNNTKYGKYHQFGTKNIPKREWMWLSRSARNKIVKVYKDILMGAYK